MNTRICTVTVITNCKLLDEEAINFSKAGHTKLCTKYIPPASGSPLRLAVYPLPFSISKCNTLFTQGYKHKCGIGGSKTARSCMAASSKF